MAIKSPDDHEKRYQAIQIYQQGQSLKRVLHLVHRGKSWFFKWLKRYQKRGIKGLRDQSRAPKRIWRKTSDFMVRKILGIRAELEAHRSRRSAFAGIGAEVIHWELQQRRVRRIPSITTIATILSRHGKTAKRKSRRAHSNHQPYPHIPAEKMGDLQQTDLVGPRHLRGPEAVTRFYSFQTVDVAGHTVHSNQFPDKQTISLCKHLVEAWRFLGLPGVSQLDNEMAASGGGRYRYSLSQVIRLHLLLGIQLVFIPQGEPGRNASVESINRLWQDRVLRRHLCPTLAVLRRTTERFLRYYHCRKPHRNLTHKEHSTRFPGVLRDQLWKSLRHLPEGFSLARYMDAKHHLSLPIARGKVSFIRKVDPNGRIEVNGASYFIRRKLEGQYVVATLVTHRKRLLVKYEKKTIKSFPFPFKGSAGDPLVPLDGKKT